MARSGKVSNPLSMACMLLLSACAGDSGGGATAIACAACNALPGHGGPPIIFGPLSGATKGASPANPQAVAGGPNFTSNGPAPANGTVFPYLQTVGLTSSDNATMAAGATATVINPATGQVRVQIGNLGIDVSILIGDQTSKQSLNGVWFSHNVAVMDHTMLGSWAVAPGPSSAASTRGMFVTGYLTPGISVPASGTAIYAGTGNVMAFVRAQPSAAELTGDASITVNFASHAVTGSLTNMEAINATGQVSVWNDVSISATQSGSRFAGTTSASSPASGLYVMGLEATGLVNGEFFGPNAQEAAAVWTLNDNAHSAIGVIGARKQ